jgi:tetratricopeptide (TPR) repeat protein
MVDYKIPNSVIFVFFLALCLILFFSALNHSFIFDDNYLIVGNQYVQNFSVQKIFSTDVFSFRPKGILDNNNYYRPLQILSYSFEYLIWKLNPLGYRLDNIILQSFNAFLLFLLIYLIFKNKILALLSGIFFCTHPAQVCLVTFIAGRSNLLETFFVLSALVTVIYYFLRQKTVYYFCSLLFYIGALLTREGALMLPVYIFICVAFLKVDKKKIGIILIPYIGIALVYVSLRNLFMPCDGYNIFNSVSLKTIGNFVVLCQSYFWQLILPLNVKVKLLDGNLIVKIFFYLCSCFVFIYSLIYAVIKKSKLIIFGWAIYLTGLLPLIKLDKIMGYFGPALTEHYVYNASIGFCILLACFILVLYTHFPKLSKILFMIIFAYFSILTLIANYNYKDETSFYKYILSIDRRNTFAHLNLGNVYYADKNYSQATNEAEEVLKVEPDAWDAYLLLGNVFKSESQYQKAIAAYQRAFLLNPGSDLVLINLAFTYQKIGQDEEALKFFNKAMGINPESPFVLANIIDLSVKHKEYDRAFLASKKIIAIYSNDEKELIYMGNFWAKIGRFKEAEFFLQEALNLFPSSTQVLENLGSLYGSISEFDKAIFCFKRALEFKPHDKKLNKLLDAVIIIKKQGRI